ncbi:hypothetical protein ABUW04_31890 [Streptacidiphilus sp. N1-10]|uniref:Chromosome partitioning protein n=1 Tax=Streptacidiphilus jeojiensis TaxID=3229225 RepID=A0ABV6XX50_9ACTN
MIEVAVGCLVAWTWRKARKVGGRADEEVDFALEAAADRVHAVIARKLNGNSELERLSEEAEAGQEEPSVVTVRRVNEAVTAAVHSDPSFAEELEQAIARLDEAKQQAGSAAAGAYGLAVAGNSTVSAGDNSFAAGVANIQGGVHFGSPSKPGQETR